MLIFLF